MSRIDALGIGGASFPANSRYAGIAVKTITITVAGAGEEVSYLARRFVPSPNAYASLGGHQVTDYDRTDLVATARLGDPMLAWRLQDANGAMHPRELMRDVGRLLVVPLPAGVPAPPLAGEEG
ncbi:hypothetical protein OF829_04555 [Sphingomonas sp. LB-2]|uniref:hypothetical protein n=1 Tax=Sphingomonas caeni TaxID=2984949 RepID=UPI00222E1E11|nr:hypothetical protein [Sphingomonas caeni]MCW3846498.1 hypothetical protein [Sphingomonas caeni]